MTDILFLEPEFKDRIWGGTRLRDVYGYDIPTSTTGECWAISGHEAGPTKVKNGEFAGKTIAELWQSNRELFGGISDSEFPLLIKILDAKADLSVQVHPDDAYANIHENGGLGKTECWYILDCDEDAHIIYGHNAQTKAQFEKMIEKGLWDALLHKVSVKPGDFFYVPAGTVHAICKGTLILETQQSSDTTYRLYDYNRLDDQGNPRELHLEKSIDVTKVPQDLPKITPSVETFDNAVKTTYVHSEFFTVEKYKITGPFAIEQTHPFLNVSILDGNGTIAGHSVQKGDHLLVPAGFGSIAIDGTMTIMTSHL